MRNKNLYPENWADEIRPAILKRDNFKCQMCPVKHRQYVFFDQSNKMIIIDRTECEELKANGYKAYRVYLQVAHRDHLKIDHSPENLFSLCPRCHRLYDKRYDTLLRLASYVKPSPPPSLRSVGVLRLPQ